MNQEQEMEYEYAFPAANRYAGETVDLASHLKAEGFNKKKLKHLQDRYQEIFSAFIAGVAWTKKND